MWSPRVATFLNEELKTRWVCIHAHMLRMSPTHGPYNLPIVKWDVIVIISPKHKCFTNLQGGSYINNLYAPLANRRLFNTLYIFLL
jgi:hypothetical protein